MKKIQMGFRLICALILFLSVLQIVCGGVARASTEADAKASPTTMSGDLEAKRASLEAMESVLTEQEHRLKEREKELDEKIQEMEKLRTSVLGELDSQRKGGEERVAKMVIVLETMSPKPASSLLEVLDDWLSVEVLKRMDSKRVAKIMNIMERNRAAKLSELLTGYYHPSSGRKLSSVPPKVNTAANGALAQNQQAKGGKTANATPANPGNQRPTAPK